MSNRAHSYLRHFGAKTVGNANTRQFVAMARMGCNDIIIFFSVVYFFYHFFKLFFREINNLNN